MRESFVFYQSFYEALKELPDDIRLKLYDMISTYALTGEETECKGIEKAVFSLIKPQLKANMQRYLNSCGTASESQAKAKRNASETQANAERTASELQAKVERKSSESQAKAKRNASETQANAERTASESRANENENENENVLPPPFYFPPQGEKKTEKELFFEKYPKYAKDKSKMRKDIDYKRLLEEFEHSRYCRNLYTVKQINDEYPLIINGDYRDKVDEKAEKVAMINAKAERDRWYDKRREKAECDARAIRAKFMKNETFAAIERRLNAMKCEMAKSELGAEQGDLKAKQKLVKLTQEQGRLQQQRLAIIEMNGLTEDDLFPKWHCKKCKDTGYDENGVACNCYDVEGGR